MKIVSINDNKDFRKGYSNGKSFVSPCLVTYIRKNKLGVCRLGITTSKKIGNAPQRNRAKRIIKEAFRQIAPEIRGGYDFVFVARVKTTKVKMDFVKNAMKSHLISSKITQKLDEL